MPASPYRRVSPLLDVSRPQCGPAGGGGSDRWGALSLRTPDQAAPDDCLRGYFGAAQEASPWHQALTQTADDAATLVERRVEASSAPAMALANRLTRICSAHSFGDPLVYA